MILSDRQKELVLKAIDEYFDKHEKDLMETERKDMDLIKEKCLYREFSLEDQGFENTNWNNNSSKYENPYGKTISIDGDSESVEINTNGDWMEFDTLLAIAREVELTKERKDED